MALHEAAPRLPLPESIFCPILNSFCPILWLTLRSTTNWEAIHHR